MPKIVRKNRTLQVEIFKTSRGQWRWHVVHAANGRLVAEAGESFINKAHAYKITGELFPHLPVMELG